MVSRQMWMAASMAALFLVLLLCQAEVMARGGGGGSGGAGGIFAIILLPFFIIYSLITTHLVRKKSAEAQALAGKLAKADPTWDIESIRKRVQHTYFKYQQAWMDRDLSICRNLLTDAFNDWSQAQIDEMLSQHRKNVMEDIKLLDSKVVQIADFADDNQDCIWVWIKGSMTDYIVDDRTSRVVKGDKQTRSFTELWKFMRVNNSWLLDEIHQTSIDELSGYYSFTSTTTDSTRIYAGRST